jgi:hypothetical protein
LTPEHFASILLTLDLAFGQEVITVFGIDAFPITVLCSDAQYAGDIRTILTVI